MAAVHLMGLIKVFKASFTCNGEESRMSCFWCCTQLWNGLVGPLNIKLLAANKRSLELQILCASMSMIVTEINSQNKGMGGWMKRWINTRLGIFYRPRIPLEIQSQVENCCKLKSFPTYVIDKMGSLSGLLWNGKRFVHSKLVTHVGSFQAKVPTTKSQYRVSRHSWWSTCILVASPITSILVSVQVDLFLVGWEFIWIRTIRLYCHSRSKIILCILYNTAQSGYFISALAFSCVIISLGLSPSHTFDGFSDKSREISLEDLLYPFSNVMF